MTGLRGGGRLTDKRGMVDLTGLQALIAAQDWAGAEKLLRRAARAKAAPAQVFYNLGKVLEAAGRPEQSGTWFRKAVAADPSYAMAWFELGRRAIALDDLDLAEKTFARVTALTPSDMDAWRTLARLHLRRGHWAEARTAWAHFDDAEARAALYRIACELGEDTGPLRARLLSSKEGRPEVIKAVTRVSRGALPLRFPRAG